MKTRWTIVGLVLGLMAPMMVAMAGPAAAAEPPPRDPACGPPDSAIAGITADERLTHDVVCTFMAFDTAATIDLAGHTLSVGNIHNDGRADAETFINGRLIITNGMFSSGNIHLRHVRETGSLQLETGGLFLERSTFDGDLSIGLGALNGGTFSAVGSFMHGNTATVGGRIAVTRSVIVGNAFTDNHAAGIRFAVDHSLIAGSLTIDPDDPFPPGDVQGDVSHNLFLGGGLVLAGFGMIGLGPTTITDNVVLHNPAYNGITVGSNRQLGSTVSGPVTLAGNLAIGNHGHGIDAESSGGIQPQIIDGGHNRAFLNQTDLQCVGVACRSF
jgi:hypothetical protein